MTALRDINFNILSSQTLMATNVYRSQKKKNYKNQKQNGDKTQQ